MVFFTCQHCGSSLKKNAVEKHYRFECKNQPNLTCVDCLKDFHGDSYIAHTQCITEDEKYSAKGFKSKPPSEKGAKKQHSWLNSVKETQLEQNMNRFQTLIINHSHNQMNVPQKRAKFHNFCKSLLGRNFTPGDADYVYNLFESTHKRNTEQQMEINNSGSKANDTKEDGTETAEHQNNGNAVNGTGKKGKKRSHSETFISEDISKNSEIEFQNGGGEDVITNGKTKLSKKERKELKKKAKMNRKNMQDSDRMETDENGCEVPENCENENIENEKKKRNDNSNVSNGESGPDSSLANKTSIDMIDEYSQNINKMDIESEKKLSKKEKKMKKKQAKFEAEMNEIDNYKKPDGELDPMEAFTETDIPKKKKKKNKNANNDADTDLPSEGVVSENNSKKRGREEDLEDEPMQKKSKDNFSQDNGNKPNQAFKWDEIIIKVLQSKGNELPIKRLAKKVITEYQTTHATYESFEMISAKFNKKIRKIPGVKLLKDRAKLVS